MSCGDPQIPVLDRLLGNSESVIKVAELQYRHMRKSTILRNPWEKFQKARVGIHYQKFEQASVRFDTWSHAPKVSHECSTHASRPTMLEPSVNLAKLSLTRKNFEISACLQISHMAVLINRIEVSWQAFIGKCHVGYGRFQATSILNDHQGVDWRKLRYRLPYDITVLYRIIY